MEKHTVREPHDPVDDIDSGDLVSRYHGTARREPPRALDRRVLQATRGSQGQKNLRAMTLAASGVLLLGLVFAIAFAPAPPQHVAAKPRLIRAAARDELSASPHDSRQPRLYSTDPPLRRDARTWLADIAALRRSGRNADAERELERFRRANPSYDLDAEHQ